MSEPIVMKGVPEIIRVEERLLAVIPLVVARQDIAAAMDPAIAEVLAVLMEQDSAPAGPCCTWHRRRPTDTFDFSVGFPVDHPVMARGRVRLERQPGGRVVRATHRGGYDGLAAAWGEFMAWIEASGLAVRPDLWECYLSGPHSSPDPSSWVTELCQPLAD